MSSADSGRATAAALPSAGTREIATRADAAIAAVRSAVARLAHGASACDAMLRTEAVVALSVKSRVRVADLLLFEAASPTHPAHGMCRNVEAELEACLRYLHALEHGYRSTGNTRELGADALLGVLAVLVEIADTRQRETIAATVVDATDWLAAAGAGVPVTMRAAVVQDRLARIASVAGECALLARIAARLVLQDGSAPPLPLVLSHPVVSPCPDEGSDANVVRRFAEDVIDRSGAALVLLERISMLVSADEQRIATFGKATHSARRVLHAMQRVPVIALPRLLEDTGLHVQAATSALHRLRALGIIREITGRYRHRVYSYDAYVAALEPNPAAE